MGSNELNQYFADTFSQMLLISFLSNEAPESRNLYFCVENNHLLWKKAGVSIFYFCQCCWPLEFYTQKYLNTFGGMH